VARVVVSMFRAKRILSAIPALAILALAGGCGGGKQQVTAAELVQKGDQICSHELSAFGQIQDHPPANASNAADQTKELVKTAESASSQLSALEPPDELRAPLQSYLSARDRAVEQMKRGQDAAENQDSAAYGAAQAAVVHGAPQRKKLAEDVGFKVCGSNAGSA
jgi:hypothetical protein